MYNEEIAEIREKSSKIEWVGKELENVKGQLKAARKGRNVLVSFGNFDGFDYIYDITEVNREKVRELVIADLKLSITRFEAKIKQYTKELSELVSKIKK